MIRLISYCVLSLLFCFDLRAQFPPAAGQEGSTAIAADSSVFIAWGTQCEIVRGPLDISAPANGDVSYGQVADALGMADNLVISLGDGGSATFSFNTPITNGSGPDFAVFENAFTDSYLELAFVEVSSNGVDFFRIPAVSNTASDTQIEGFGVLDPTKLNNLAGKYRAIYGTPFDLEELAGTAGLDLDHVTHVKIIDVVGSIDPSYATYDSNNQIVNDPWPTPFESGGFDLDAIGVINQQAASIIEQRFGDIVSIYPVPAKQHLYIRLNNPDYNSFDVKLIDLTGRVVKSRHCQNLSNQEFRIELAELVTGFYQLIFMIDNSVHHRSVVIN